jgi:molybdenum cofactor biosynthesis enzyme MoaA
MPSEGIQLSPRSHILSDDEVLRLATLFVKSGVNKIRLTGGEPTVRKGLLDIVGKCLAIASIVTMSTSARSIECFARIWAPKHRYHKQRFGTPSSATTINCEWSYAFELEVGLCATVSVVVLIDNTRSLDTLDPFKFEIMTRRPGHAHVLRSLETAIASPGLKAVKLNVVVMKGLNDHEVMDFIELTRDKKISVRFIEFMPFTGESHRDCD